MSDQYDRRKKAHDQLQKSLIDSGVPADKARKIANETATTTDNKNDSKKKG